MYTKLSLKRLLCCFIISISLCLVVAQFEYNENDAFDFILNKIRRTHGGNCHIKPRAELFLPNSTVSQIPDIKEVNINPVFPNRTDLLHIHNMAHSRAFFFSYVLQTRFKRPSSENDTYEYDPGFMYYFLSAVADVAANPRLNASAIYFQSNMSFSSSYRDFFNKTMPLFGPRAFRMDDHNDPVHLERVSTLNFIQVDDLGAIPPKGMNSKNYTHDDYWTNEWYKVWLKERKVKKQDALTTYTVKIRYANNTNETFIFHGPNAPEETPGPVKFLRPYFDCGRSNKWLVPAVSPIADLYPRHTGFRHIEFPTYTAVAVMELDFDRIDINQCPPVDGSDEKNYFYDTAKCKKDTTECEPLDGYGFRRGGYQCRCRPGNRLPNMVRRPYLGELIERATLYQYRNSFNCEKIGFIQKLPIKYYVMDEYQRERYLSKGYGNETGFNATRNAQNSMNAVIDYLMDVTDKNCHTYAKDKLILRGDMAYGSEKQFENEARMALRTANFLSAFLQIVDHEELFSGLRVSDLPLTEDQMMAEVLSIILGNSRVWASGMYWDRNKFPKRVLFAPFAHKTTLNTRKFAMEDLARLNSTKEAYTNQPWFRKMKNRWSTNFDDLEKYYVKLKLRHNSSGMHDIKYERYPTFYKAAELRHGEWSEPQFDCGGVGKWVLRYSAPFFGWDALRSRLEFKGAVQVTVDLMKLDINQCPNEQHTQNAFKNSHKCDRKTSYCVPIQGRGYTTGGYKCECVQGYEYPLEDPITYIDGQVAEGEFMNIVNRKPTRYDFMKCRIAGQAGIKSNFVLLVVLMLLVKIMGR